LISANAVYQTAYRLNEKTAINIPDDVRERIAEMYRKETHKLPRYVFGHILENYGKADADNRAMCSDTGVPRFYVKIGNDAIIENGPVGLEGMLRKATADATSNIPLRPNRVHPLTRKDNNNNVGIHAPSVDYSFEPDADWIDITAVHKGGLFGSDYRMLFPVDGTDGIKRFFLDTISEFFRRGMTCPPVTIGVGIGGTQDVSDRIAMEAACLRLIGQRNPDPDAAKLEVELLDLGNKSGFGPNGYRGDNSVLDVHVELAYAHTGGMPVTIHQFCLAQRRATARIHSDDTVEFRKDPEWFTDFYRRDTIQQEAGEHGC
jgi:L(+)-tartrate dehydratase alpha subunit